MAQKDNETKQKILDISLKLIKEKGYDNVTLNDICTAAQISKHTFYYYFSSKDEILLEFYTIPREIKLHRLHSILSAENNYEQLWQLMEPHIDFFAESGFEIVKRVFIANMTRHIGTFDTGKIRSEVFDAEVAIIKRAQEAGELRNTSDPVELLKSIHLQIMGVTLKWCMTNGSFDLKNTARSFIEVCLDVIPELRKAKR